MTKLSRFSYFCERIYKARKLTPQLCERGGGGNSPTLYELSRTQYRVWKLSKVLLLIIFIYQAFIKEAISQPDDTMSDDKKTVNNELYRMWTEVAATLYRTVTAFDWRVWVKQQKLSLRSVDAPNAIRNRSLSNTNLTCRHWNQLSVFQVYSLQLKLITADPSGRAV